MEQEHVHHLYWWRHCKEPLGPLDDEYKKIIPLTAKPLPKALNYGYLGENNAIPIIISARLGMEREVALLRVLKAQKKAIR